MAASHRVALITGAGSGLGRAIALALAWEGTSIAALDIVEDGLRSLDDDLPRDRYAWARADVTDFDALKKATRELVEKLGPTDLLIANAGIGMETTAASLNPLDIARIIDVNLIGVTNSIAAVLPGMLERRHGHLVAISSVASARGLPRMFGYCASKAGVNAIMDGLRVELRDKGIAVTTICPGWIRTPMTKEVAVPMPGIMEPAEAARHVLHAIRRRKKVYMFPRSIAWQIRAITWLPLSWQDRYLARVIGNTV